MADLAPLIKMYSLSSYNCWWFSAVAIGTLQVLGSDWTTKPSRDWAKKAVQALERSTRDGTHRVTACFADRWHSGVLPTVPITNDIAWESSSVRLPASNSLYDTPECMEMTPLLTMCLHDY
jgi:hypothetical protein